MKTESRMIQTLIYSRVSGFYTPVIQYNKGKKEEFSERKYLNIKRAMESRPENI